MVFRNSRLIRNAIPFMTIVVGGSFGLQYVTSMRYEFRKVSRATEEEIDTINQKKDPNKIFDVESEHAKLKEKDEADTWENVRGPRPWEDSKEIQDQLRQENKALTEVRQERKEVIEKLTGTDIEVIAKDRLEFRLQQIEKRRAQLAEEKK